MSGFINFDERVALVTGAGSRRGIGFWTAKLIGFNGGKVVLVSTTNRIYERAQELRDQGIEAKGYVADLTDRMQVEKLTDDVIRMFGRIDILINNAGMVQVGETQISVHVADMSYEHWDHGIDRNLNITFNVTRQVIPHMISQGYGRIVNVSSVTGPVVSNPGSSVYGAAKSAITGMSKALAIETAGYGITVNNVLPGWIATDSQTESEKIGAENTPAGRGGTPEEIANLNVFLASDKASYITGQDFIVDGGNTIQEYKGPKKHYY